jgi:hypothetical protein
MVSEVKSKELLGPRDRASGNLRKVDPKEISADNYGCYKGIDCRGTE